VDDDRVVLDLQRALLQAAGFAVETVDDPHEALRAFSRKAPDAVVLDYAMPSMNGGVLALRMRRLRAQIPLILNSGSAEIPKEEAELFDRNLAKGLAPVLLISALHEIFAGRKDGDLRAPSDGVLHRVIAETRCAVITIKLPVSVSAQPAVEVPELTTGSLN
jgi:CheY-like chemotaxis protein